MKIAYLDCLAGISGDMLLGAVVDVGLPVEELLARLAPLKLGEEFELRAKKVSKNGFAATKVDVSVRDTRHSRSLGDIEAVIQASELSGPIRTKALGIFRRLAEVEAGIHGLPVEEVHLHEVGSLDTIVDVVGGLSALDALGVEKVYGSPLPLGRGFVHGSHGPIPLPAPAALALLQGVPVRGSEIETELVTPTGAALFTTLCAGYGPLPTMRLTGLGYGAGERDLPIPNLLRLLLGEQAEASGVGIEVETLVMLETNVDDNSAEINGYVMDRLFASGALDVFFTPIQMKKNRPATLLSVLCRPEAAAALERILFLETSTLGVRRTNLERAWLERRSETVETPYGPVRVKVARLPDGTTKRAPEYEDCRQAAERAGVPLRVIYESALGGEPPRADQG